MTTSDIATNTFPKETGAAHDPVHDEVLGTMLWDEDEGGWVTRPVLASFRIVVAGTQGPDATLLPAARALTAHARKVAAEVSSLLEAFAHRLPEAASEVLALQIDAIHLNWPDRPGDGMIYFKGPDPNRLWRCDYIAGVAQCLCFDD
jgi:hypothetical protein